MNMSQYARHRGVTPRTIRKAIDKKKIPYKKKGKKILIDPDVADRAWEKNGEKPRHPSGQAEPGTRPVMPRDHGDFEDEDYHDYNQANTAYKAYQAKLHKLKFEQECADLVPRAEIDKAAFDCSRITRDNMLAIAARTYQELAAESNPHEVYRKLTEEITKALEDTSREIGDFYENGENASGDSESIHKELLTGT
jgi:hypothetical protein